MHHFFKLNHFPKNSTPYFNSTYNILYKRFLRILAIGCFQGHIICPRQQPFYKWGHYCPGWLTVYENRRKPMKRFHMLFVMVISVIAIIFLLLMVNTAKADNAKRRQELILESAQLLEQKENIRIKRIKIFGILEELNRQDMEAGRIRAEIKRQKEAEAAKELENK